MSKSWSSQSSPVFSHHFSRGCEENSSLRPSISPSLLALGSFQNSRGGLSITVAQGSCTTWLRNCLSQLPQHPHLENWYNNNKINNNNNNSFMGL